MKSQLEKLQKKEEELARKTAEIERIRQLELLKQREE